MKVIDYMTRSVIKVHRTDTLATARDLMAENNVRHLVVVEGDGDLAGILSDRDSKLASLPLGSATDEADARFSRYTLVKSIMSNTPTFIEPDDSVEQAAQMMIDQHISALPVIRERELIGIITTTDLLRALIDTRQTA